MEKLLQLLAYLDWSVLPRTIVQSFIHADWRAARERGGAAGVAAEAAASLIGTNCTAFFAPIGGPWSGAQIERLLRSKGIKMWGVGFANGELFFRVSRQQAAYAQYLMERAGVPLLHGGAPIEQPESGPTVSGPQVPGASLERASGGHAHAPKGGAISLESVLDTIESLLP